MFLVFGSMAKTALENMDKRCRYNKLQFTD
uniref:Uncharacterized protein n=1 Tax=Rhizophora mucronata TaxID=61149 RepID=A0A2P2NCG6_RHIMU